uniref:Uncharacterized protein n=1 Tax=Arundo donax TaxID=35708 RepID=A0A0A9E8M6_ARUDO
MDLDRRQPRARLRAGARREHALQALHPPLPHPLPRRRQHRALLVLRQDRLRARHRARLLLRLRQVHAAVDVAAGGAPARGPQGHAMAHRARALALVQQQQLPLHGGRDDARPVRELARQGQGRPRPRRPCPRLRAQPPRLQHRLRHRQRQVHAGPGHGGAGLRHHRRRRQHRGHRQQLHAAAAELLGVPGGQLRARHLRDREPDARLLRVAPQSRRRQGRCRRRLVHQQVLDAHRRL